MEQKLPSDFNHTTQHTSTPSPGTGSGVFYALVPFVLLTLLGCVVAVVLYIRRRLRSDELRHRLIPLYSYDPAEEQEWGDERAANEDEELNEPLYKEGKLSLSTAYGSGAQAMLSRP